MNRATVAEARVYQSWLDCQEALKRAIAPLTLEQLQQRPLPGRRSPGEVAEHIVFGRALHVHRSLGAAAAELTPFLRWNERVDPPRFAREIVEGLDVTWRVISEWVTRGTPLEELDASDVAIANVIWGLLDHDLPHAGQLSMLLRAGGLRGVEI